jgi:flagellar biosynthesis GTPase FlhF
MKIHRFTAPSNQKAISMIYEALGPDALIYKTRSVPEGIEILASCPSEAANYNGTHDVLTQLQSTNSLNSTKHTHEDVMTDIIPDVGLIEELNSQLQVVTQRIKKLSNHIAKIQKNYAADDDRKHRHKKKNTREFIKKCLMNIKLFK